jgi:anti-sigma regulatory factor (Ser/Thr protein kinase)
MHPFKPGNDAEAAVLAREFDAGALAGLREAVLGYATACGMPEDRAIDVMLAVHELAANAVRHGPGHGLLRIRVTASALRCEVSDPGPSSRDGTAPWPVEQGHGLWLVHTAADHLRVTSGPHGSLITVMFALPAAAAPLRRPAGPASQATAPAADPRHRTVPISPGASR